MTVQPAEQLVGRAAELGSLDEALSEVGRRRLVALELAGEPGIGKTCLLAELGARADARGHAGCSRWSRRPSRSCCSTTCTGPTPVRSSCWARCCAARRPPRS